MNEEAAELVARFGLVPLPGEGGHYARVWAGPPAGPGGRPSGTAILFLITPDGFSALHRLATDELWHFHAGDPAELAVIDPVSGMLALHVLGNDFAAGQRPGAVVRAGSWQGARLRAGTRGWALFGCTMAPGWDEREFELGDRGSLLAAFPAHAALIRSLTR